MNQFAYSRVHGVFGFIDKRDDNWVYLNYCIDGLLIRQWVLEDEVQIYANFDEVGASFEL